MQEEIDALMTNDTWDLVPQNFFMNIVRYRWIYKTKLKVDGNLDYLKARLIAKGYNKKKVSFFHKLLAQLSNQAVLIQTVLTIATIKGWSIRHIRY